MMLFRDKKPLTIFQLNEINFKLKGELREVTLVGEVNLAQTS